MHRAPQRRMLLLIGFVKRIIGKAAAARVMQMANAAHDGCNPAQILGDGTAIGPPGPMLIATGRAVPLTGNLAGRDLAVGCSPQEVLLCPAAGTAAHRVYACSLIS